MPNLLQRLNRVRRDGALRLAVEGEIGTLVSMLGGRLGPEAIIYNLRTFSEAGRTFDLALSVEVAEHLDPALAQKLLDVCCTHAPIVLPSAAQLGQPVQGHINLQPKAYWEQQFIERSFVLDKDRTTKIVDHLLLQLERGVWVANNLGVYVRTR